MSQNSGFSTTPIHIKKQTERIDVLIETIEKASKGSTYLSILAIIIAVTSIGITAFYSWKDDAGDQAWKKQQIETLEKQNKILQEQNSILLQLINSKKP